MFATGATGGAVASGIAANAAGGRLGVINAFTTSTNSLIVVLVISLIAPPVCVFLISLYNFSIILIDSSKNGFESLLACIKLSKVFDNSFELG